MKIAIIGAGLTGSTILETIIKHKNFNSNIHISIFDKREFYGAGFPHENDSMSRVLNVQSHLMSVDDNNPNEFVEWLKSNSKKESFEKVSPRTYYGQYLHDHFTNYYNNENVDFINDEVLEVIPNILSESENNKINSFDIKTKDNEFKNFDYLFLAIGHPIYKDLYDFKHLDKYIWNPYPLNQKLANIDKDKKIGIIGTGATSLDVFRHLISNYDFKYPISFLSRSSLFATPDFTYDLETPEYIFSMNEDWIKSKLDNNKISLEDIVELTHSDFEKNNIDFYENLKKLDFKSLEDYRNFIDNKDKEIIILIDYFKKLFPYLAILFGKLSDEDKDILYKKYDKDIERFITLIPSKTFDWIYDEINKDNVKIVRGLKNITHDNGKFNVEADENVEIDLLINTTGFTFNLEENINQNTLLKSLHKNSLIKSDSKDNFISVEWPSCNAISDKYGKINNLYVQGMWIGSKHYRNNDALSVNRLAKYVVNKFMNEVNNGGVENYID